MIRLHSTYRSICLFNQHESRVYVELYSIFNSDTRIRTHISFLLIVSLLQSKTVYHRFSSLSSSRHTDSRSAGLRLLEKKLLKASETIHQAGITIPPSRPSLGLLAGRPSVQVGPKFGHFQGCLGRTFPGQSAATATTTMTFSGEASLRLRGSPSPLEPLTSNTAGGEGGTEQPLEEAWNRHALANTRRTQAIELRTMTRQKMEHAPRDSKSACGKGRRRPYKGREKKIHSPFLGYSATA